MVFRLPAYLDRLGLTDVPEGLAGLRAVQEAHMRAIPFENLDPLLGRVPRLDPGSLSEKLVARARGGYCFEHNGLFGRALEALGYAPRTLLARVRNGAPQGGARTHQAFEVVADDARWLADTGFGGHGALHPVAFDDPGPQVLPNGAYRVVRDESAGETVLERRAGADWISLYGFDGLPAREIDIEAANFLCARWESAPFTANLMLALHGADGRRAMFNRAFTLGMPPDTETRVIDSPAEFADVLRDEFRLDVTDAEIAEIWARIETAPTRR
jgi:N-hydroxyarylamine O-acetyltransferase